MSRQTLLIGSIVEVKIGIAHYDAIVLAVDWLGHKVKLGWPPEDEAHGDESWWSLSDIDVRQ